MPSGHIITINTNISRRLGFRRFRPVLGVSPGLAHSRIKPPNQPLPWQNDASRLIEAEWRVSVVTFPRDDLGFRYLVAAQKEDQRIIVRAESLEAGFAQLLERVLGEAATE